MVEISMHTSNTFVSGIFEKNCYSIPENAQSDLFFRHSYSISVTQMIHVSIWLLSILTFAYFVTVSPVKAQTNDNIGHLTIENAAEISAVEANRIYDQLKARMAQGYGMSGLQIARDYQSWKQFNSSSYISATHGQRFVNNFANHIGKAYGMLKQGQRFPEGTILAKDSITIMDSGKFFPGALFVMEKLKSGTSPDTADWRYIVVNPDGSLYGDTTGTDDESQLVGYCHACHQAKSNQDYVFYIPLEYRLKEK